MVFAKQPKRTLRTVIRELVDRSNSETARIRLLEQEKNVVKSRMDTIEQTLTSQKKLFEKTVSGLESSVEKTSERAIKVEATLKELIKEIKKLATAPKIKELESLIGMYNPIKSQFITKEEVERLIERKTEESRQK